MGQTMASRSANTTVMDVISTVLPEGTTAGKKSWTNPPAWPPDLFAAVATITERSGLYSEPIFMAYWAANFVLSQTWIDEVRQIGKQWAETGEPPRAVREMWKELVGRHGKSSVGDHSNNACMWKQIVFRLLSTADEACSGIGFQPSAKSDLFQRLYLDDYPTWLDKRLQNPQAIGGDFLPYLPHSLCVRVPQSVLCVQPKTSTPAVGCTLRSLTHHLALLPGVANVSTSWHLASKRDEDLGAFNLLVVP